MKREDLFNAITNIRDDQVEKAKPKPHSRRWIAAPVAAVLVITLLATALWGFPRLQTLHTDNIRLATAVYPALKSSTPEEDSSGPFEEQEKSAESAGLYTGSNEEAETDSSGDLQAFWDNHTQAREEYANMRDEYADRLGGFWLDSAQIFLSQEESSLAQQVLEENENRLFSPIELYIALGMSAEISTGEARQEILDLLNSPDIEDLRQSVNRIWNASYCREEDASGRWNSHTLLLANSIWLNGNLDYHQDVLDVLAGSYYADSFRGKMGSESYDKLRQEWIDEKTNGFLSDHLDGMKMPPDATLTLTSTTYYKGRWEHEFAPEKNEEGKFQSPQGEKDCTYMCQTIEGAYFYGDSFGAVSKDLYGGDRMLFILPDEGVSTDDLLADPQCRSFLQWGIKNTGGGADEIPCGAKWANIRLKVPKFDITSSIEMKDGLEHMGVGAIFTYGSRSFTPLTDREFAFTSVPQSCRFKIDEEGCEGASVTAMEGIGAAAPPEDYVDFVLDRPFLFLLVSGQGLPIYIGVVNQP